MYKKRGRFIRDRFYGTFGPLYEKENEYKNIADKFLF
jgi:hypothetical protein